MCEVLSELQTEESMDIQFLDREILRAKCVHSANKEICMFIKRAKNGCYNVNIILRLNYLWIYYSSCKNVELSGKGILAWHLKIPITWNLILQKKPDLCHENINQRCKYFCICFPSETRWKLIWQQHAWSMWSLSRLWSHLWRCPWKIHKVKFGFLRLCKIWHFSVHTDSYLRG